MGLSIGGFIKSAQSSVSNYVANTAKGAINKAYGSATEALNRSIGIGGNPADQRQLSDQNAQTEIQQAYTPNAAYQVILSADTDDGEPLIVSGYYGAETLNFGFGGSYDAPFAQGLLSMMGGSTLETIARLNGVQSVTKDMTAQIWQGATRISIDIPLIIAAQYDGEQEILRTIYNLARMSLPSETESGFLRAPGPRPNINRAVDNIGNTFNNISKGFSDFGSALSSGSLSSSSLTQVLSGGPTSILGATADFIGSPVRDVEGNIGLKIGNTLHLESVVVESIGNSIEWQLDNRGKPMFATINIHVSTFKIPTAEEMMNILMLSAPTPSRAQNQQSQNFGSIDLFGNNLGGFIGGG